MFPANGKDSASFRTGLAARSRRPFDLNTLTIYRPLTSETVVAMNDLNFHPSRPTAQLAGIRRSFSSKFLFVCLCPLGLLLAGCGDSSNETEVVDARPITVTEIQLTSPAPGRSVTGSVASWKTEQIGFEVSGRVKWVLEPGRDVAGNMFDSDGNVLVEGTELAEIDDERYQLAVEAAQAQVNVAMYDKQSAEINATVGVPARIEASAAEQQLAKDEYDRFSKLIGSNATSQSELDQAAANLRTAAANAAGLQAEQKQADAVLQGMDAAEKQAIQAHKDAKRDLRDTTLYSSFRGQVADVHVVPGSLVSQGSAVLTVQMMDPIKVEFELSAERSRRIKTHTILPVTFDLPDGSTETRPGYVYMIDPIANPATRTYTLTLLVFNEKNKPRFPDEVDPASIATVRDIWRLDIPVMPDTPDGMYFVSAAAIGNDSQGDYLWRCKNAEIEKNVPEILDVEKVYIKKGELSLPFLGNWTFQEISALPEFPLDATRELFAGQVFVDGGVVTNWIGDKMVLQDSTQDWQLRPGDLVGVALDDAPLPEGFYLPMEAIYEDGGQTYVFVAGSESKTTVRKVPVTLGTASPSGSSKQPENVSGQLVAGSLQQVSPITPDDLGVGDRVVVDGVHFLRDGELVRVVDVVSLGDSR